MWIKVEPDYNVADIDKHGDVYTITIHNNEVPRRFHAVEIYGKEMVKFIWPDTNELDLGPNEEGTLRAVLNFTGRIGAYTLGFKVVNNVDTARLVAESELYVIRYGGPEEGQQKIELPVELISDYTPSIVVGIGAAMALILLVSFARAG